MSKVYYENDYFVVSALNADEINFLVDHNIYINEKEAPHTVKVVNKLTEATEYYSSALAQAIAYARQHNTGLKEFLEENKDAAASH